MKSDDGICFYAFWFMRTLVLLILFVLPVMVFAQVDSSSLEPDPGDISQPAVPGEQAPQVDENQPGYEDANIKIIREEVPMFLQKILRDEKYRGWESGGVYRNEQGTMFRVEVRDGMNNQTYWFDQNGSMTRAD